MLALILAAGLGVSPVEVPTPPQAEPLDLVLDSPKTALAELPAGSQAPDFTLKDLSGNAVQLSALKGKVVMLEFWATWCGPCQTSMPKVKALHDNYSSKGLVVLAISIDQDEKDVRDYVKSNPWPFTIICDNPKGISTAFEYNNKQPKISIPKSVLIGKDGKIILGSSSPEKPELEQEIQKALK